MSESLLWENVRAGMRGLWRAQRLEDKLTKGIPDVVFEYGWLELKWSARKVKEGRVQTLPHFKPEQRAFLMDWDNSYLLWKIGREHFLFSDHFDLIGHVDIPNLHKVCAYHWEGKPNWQHLAAMLHVKSRR